MTARNIHLVAVTTDDRKHHLWAAATAREDAVDRVLNVIPEGWTASLLDEPWSDSAVLNMRLGEVREITRIPGAARRLASPTADERYLRRSSLRK